MHKTTYKYNIGERIFDEKRDLIILDRKIDKELYYYKRNNVQKSGYNHIAKYKIKCNKCGYDSSTYYRNGEEYSEYWMTQKSISYRKCGCPICIKIPQITVVGINSIVDNEETKWMIPYFQGGYEEAKKYSPYSNKEKFFICPDCGRIKDITMKISSLNIYHSCCCVCSDGISYPNKYGFELFNNQLSTQIDKFIREYHPEWANPYRYDFYFEIDNKKYICEFDGGLGHGKAIHGASTKTLEDSIKIDKLKDRLAKEHDIFLVRIDVSVSDSDYISNKILQSDLNEILDFSNVDFSKCDEFACSNLTKKICMDFESNGLSNFELCNKYNLSTDAIRIYLNKGRKIGWVKRERVIKRNPEQYVKRGIKPIMYINSNGEKEIFSSANELSKISLNKFGVFIPAQNIRNVCSGYLKTTCGISGFEYA